MPDVNARHLPLYHRLGAILREKITSGEIGAGSRLPTESELMREYGLSRITVRQALTALEQDGLVQRFRGKGTFVRSSSRRGASLELTGFIEDLIAMGLQTRVRIVEFRDVPAPVVAAKALGVAPGSEVLLVRRVRSTGKNPFSYIIAYLPPDVGKRLTRGHLRATPLLKLLETRCHLELGEAHQAIKASLADAECSERLGVPIGAPLLLIERVVYAVDGRPVEYVTTYYRADRYTYRVKLKRGPKGSGRWADR